jgi:hypothetical protein
MKKVISITLLGLTACVTSFAQGNFTFNNGSTSLVWDDFASFGTFVKAGPDIEVAVLWSANTNAVPTNIRNGLATPTNGFYITSWAGIFSDPNFQLAHDTSAGNPVIVNTCGGPAPFAGIYTGGIHGINGTSANQTIQLYVLGWQKAFGIDPVAAAAAGAWVGGPQRFNTLWAAPYFRGAVWASLASARLV